MQKEFSKPLKVTSMRENKNLKISICTQVLRLSVELKDANFQVDKSKE